MSTVIIYLEGGKTIIATCPEEDYDEIIQIWIEDKGLMQFDNCAVRSEKVLAIEYV